MVTRAIGVAGVALLLAGQAGSAQQAQASATGAWVREPAAGATSTAAFAVIENPSMYEIYVVSVSADAAEAAEVVTGPPDRKSVV